MSKDIGEKTELLKIVRDDVFNLTDSPLYSYRKSNEYYPVLGEGSHDSKIMFIGEAPGKNEAEQGRPFCGAAGRILSELLDGIGLARENVYITNIVKDRPPENRDPTPEEIAIYAPFLDRQIEIIKPKVIATLGRFSMEYIMNRYGLSDAVAPISKLHGKLFNTTISDEEVNVMPFYHPAASIYNRTTKEDLVNDFKKLKKIVNDL